MSARWHSTLSARPLRNWRSDQLQAACGVLEDALSAWASAWGLQLPQPVACTCAPVRRLDVQEAPALQGRSGEGAAWFLPSRTFAAQVTQALFGSSVTTPLALEVAQACATDAGRRIFAALRLDAAAAVPAGSCDASSWRGDVVAVLPFEARLVLDGPCVEALLRSLGLQAQGNPAPPSRVPPLVSVAQALKDAPLHLQVHLEGCELDFGELQGLQIGDVLLTNHPLERPASVRSAQGATLFSGYLARSQGRKAVELAPRTEGIP